MVRFVNAVLKARSNSALLDRDLGIGKTSSNRRLL